MDELQLSVDFSNDVELDMPEDATVARLAIFVGDDCLTRNRPHRPRLSDASETVFGPMAGLVDWLIDNWAPIHWETHTPFPKSVIRGPGSKKPAIPGLAEAFANWRPYFEDDNDYGLMSSDEANVAAFADWQNRHQLGHASSDLALPSIVILPEDRHVLVSVDRLPSQMNATVDFLGPYGTNRSPSLFVFNKTTFRQELKDFVDLTLAQAFKAPKYAYWADWLKQRWETAQEEEENVGRRFYWMLGDLGGSRVEDLRAENPRLSDGLRQLLLDCKFVSRKLELDATENLVDEYALKLDSVLPKSADPGWETVSKEKEVVSSLLPEFAQGYQLARMVRKKLGLGIKPVVNLTKTLKRLDVEIEDDAPSPLFRVAVCAMRGKRAHIIPSSLDTRMATETGNRFACASALGRLLWQSRSATGSTICAAQGDYSMLTQSRRANAFAAEFLLPREVTEGIRPEDSRMITQLSEQFGISHSAAEWHAYNVANDPVDYWI